MLLILLESDVGVLGESRCEASLGVLLLIGGERGWSGEGDFGDLGGWKDEETLLVSEDDKSVQKL